MTTAKTLLELAGADLRPPPPDQSCLVLIDLQNEYRAGPIAVTGVDAAVARAARLLARARERGVPVFHIAHLGRAGGMFDPDGERGRIIGAVAPAAGEAVIGKTLPNAFAGTDLAARLAATGRTDVVVAGFMTHMCVSSTARAALDLGFRATVDAAACASRDLPDGRGGSIDARTVHEVALAELADRFAIVVRDGDMPW
ncbi:MAG: cysteine hydrolase family protein [Xanthobacteraceae bacterium]|nr:cysteine hydrolase family protein [Xanthobacteraceae bacterium]